MAWLTISAYYTDVFHLSMEEMIPIKVFSTPKADISSEKKKHSRQFLRYSKDYSPHYLIDKHPQLREGIANFGVTLKAPMSVRSIMQSIPSSIFRILLKLWVHYNR